MKKHSKQELKELLISNFTPYEGEGALFITVGDMAKRLENISQVPVAPIALGKVIKELPGYRQVNQNGKNGYLVAIAPVTTEETEKKPEQSVIEAFAGRSVSQTLADMGIQLKDKERGELFSSLSRLKAGIITNKKLEETVRNSLKK